MQNQNQAPQTPTQEFPASSAKSWRSGAIPVLLSILVILLVAVGYLWYQNQQLKKMVLDYQVQIQPTPTPAATADPMSDWKTYTNSKNGFELKFPPTFIYPQEFTPSDSNHFSTRTNLDGPREISGNDLLLEIQVYPDLDSDSMQKVKTALTAQIGSISNQPFQPIGKIEKLTENSFKESPPDPNEATYYLGLYEKSGTVYVVKLFGLNNENNNQKLVFDQILSTFKFLDNDTQVACTMEAKICPDGSSVGRSGPNCEFTPCPTP